MNNFYPEDSLEYEPPESIAKATESASFYHQTANGNDLERILAELSQFSSYQNQIQQAEQVPEEIAQLQNLQGLQIQQQQPPKPQSFHIATIQNVNCPTIVDTPPSRSIATPPAQPSRTPPIDPATIFDWPQALRCVNKIAAQNPNLAISIKGMINDQERNVQQWWKDREALLVRQAGRVDSIKELNETIKAIGGIMATPPTADEDRAERDAFDKKVYNASQQMHNFHASELKKLGVPFFGVNPNFVVANDLQQTNAARNPFSKAMMTQDELVELQKKMVQYLEDMYKD